MRLLVLGGGGMLGQAVVAAAAHRDLEVEGLDRSALDLTDTNAIADQIATGVDVVVNCAAYTAVDQCEQEPALAMEVNGDAVGRLAALCGRRQVGLVHVSSDYVFGAAKGSVLSAPLVEGHPVSPTSVYGRSKELGERLALQAGASVVRASWLFGPGGSNFVTTMLRLADQDQPIRVVDDQVGCPTYTPDLAEALLRVAELSQSAAAEFGPGVAPERRLFHYANPPAVSWFGFAKVIFEVFDKEVDLSACSTAEFPRPARRPAFSALDTQLFETVFSQELRPWRSALAHYRSVLEASTGSPANAGPRATEGSKRCAS